MAQWPVLLTEYSVFVHLNPPLSTRYSQLSEHFEPTSSCDSARFLPISKTLERLWTRIFRRGSNVYPDLKVWAISHVSWQKVYGDQKHDQAEDFQIGRFWLLIKNLWWTFPNLGGLENLAQRGGTTMMLQASVNKTNHCAMERACV